MGGYLGNPKLVMMTQDAMPIANFEYPVDPTVDVNPVRVPVSWLNTATGRLWTCIDNTTDANVWKSQGPITSEKESFTPDFSVAGWTNVTWTGQKRRIGNILHLEVRGVLTGTPTGTALTMTLPDSLQIDESTIPINAAGNYAVGELTAWQSTLSRRAGMVVPLSSTRLRLTIFEDDPGAYEQNSSITPSAPWTWASGHEINFVVALPISGWNVDTIS